MKPDLTFESTAAATGAALLIAFSALRWSRGRKTPGARDPRDIALHRAEVLVTVAALIVVTLVIAVSLYSLADGRPLASADRKLSVRFLLLSAGIFIAGTLVEQLTTSDPGTSPGSPLSSPRYAHLWTGATASLTSGYVLLQTVVTDDLAGVLIATGAAIATGLVVWGIVALVATRMERSSRADLLTFANEHDLRTGALTAAHSSTPAVTALWNPEDPSREIFLSPAAARALIDLHEARRFTDPAVRDLSVTWQPFGQRLVIHDERLRTTVGVTPSPRFGLIRLDFSLRGGTLKLHVLEPGEEARWGGRDGRTSTKRPPDGA